MFSWATGTLHFGERSDVIVTAFSWHFLVIDNYVCLEFCDRLQEALGVFTPIQRQSKVFLHNIHTSAHRVIFSLLGNKKRFTVIENVTLYLD